MVKDDAPHADVMDSIDSMDDDELAALKQRIYEAEQARKAQAETSAEKLKLPKMSPRKPRPLKKLRLKLRLKKPPTKPAKNKS